MTEQMTEQAAPVEAAVQADAPKWSPEAEQEARALGWKAPDEWKGEIPSGYIDDPTRYLERAESFAPFRKIKEKLGEVEKTSQDALRRIENATAKQIERERERHQQELSRIKAEKVAAVEVGDVQAFKALEAKEDAIRKEMQPEQPEALRQPAPELIAGIERWAADKPWFKQDMIMTRAAADFYAEAERSGMSDQQAILKFVDRRLGETFAALAPKAPRDSAVESGLTLGGNAKPNSFDALPRDAKDAFQRFVERGVIEDSKQARTQWAEDYNAA